MFYKIIGILLIIGLWYFLISNIRKYPENRNLWGGLAVGVAALSAVLAAYGGLLIIRNDDDYLTYIMFGCLIGMVREYFSKKRDGAEDAFRTELLPLIIALVIGLVIALVLVFN